MRQQIIETQTTNGKRRERDMKRIITVGALAIMSMTGQAEAAKWVYNVVDTSNGKITMLDTSKEYTCNYQKAVSAARKLVGDNKSRYFNVWVDKEDDVTCPRVSRAAKKALVEGQTGN
jgi:hypothetical protein